MRRLSAHIFLFSGSILLLLAQTALADTLRITSTPPGATVEIDGLKVGTTPYETKLPGGYFHRTAFGIGSHLEHSMRLRVIKEGFTSKEIEMTEGPVSFIGFTPLATEYRGSCWLLKTNHFDIALEPASKSFTGTVVTAGAGNSKAEMRPELPVEDVVQQSKPSVVLLRRPDGHGAVFSLPKRE